MNPHPFYINSAELNRDQVHTAAKEVMASTFPDVQINGYRYTQNEIWNVLLNASANRTSIKAASDWLKDAPSPNWIYTYLKEQVFEPCGLDCIERRGNESLESTFPKGLKKSSRKMAIDLVLIPFYGDVATRGVYRSKARRSTTKFFCYASAYVIKKNKRVTIAFTFVRPEDTLLEVLLRLDTRIDDLKIRIKRLYLDRAFARVDILMYLDYQPYVSVIALPKRGKVLKALESGKASYKTFYTMRNPELGEITFPLWVACRYSKGRAKRKGVQYLFFAVLGDCRSMVLQVAEEYRHRFGIETSYRIMNQARAKTTSTNPALRLLLVAMGFLLSNLWVYLKWALLLQCRKRGVKTAQFTFELFRRFVVKTIENLYGTVAAVKL